MTVRMKGQMIALAAIMLLPLTAQAYRDKVLDSRENLDPRFPITQPVSTWWHELWPNYSNVYHLSSWYDNGDGYLSESDIIDITDATGVVSWWHVDLVTITIWLTPKQGGPGGIGDFMGDGNLHDIMYNPVSSWWEWIPPGSGGFHLSSWFDNGDGYLSESDQIDIFENGQVSYWHVDRVTTNIWISPEPSSFAAVGAGLLGLVALRRRRK
ncbi:MAG: hypothetical protein AMXMBFR61_07260 [Fimbriimonadales bacterium]